ncbi:hypothetical protein [Sandaracinus amylolyticus]|uniref:Lipoprotein n=1 Tax=Sandaracinus amylolyticus TaxID=927083 RepID=A0A0F6SI44_9BACT|nr:hypothetical protein [Sandaracinus amylolyticus]AKF11549.1 hypothetical protein DB32_008698 [Sandaracinus amylolyticus]
MTRVALVLALLVASCDLPADRRAAYAITDWTLSTTSCEDEGDDVRAMRVSTHLLVNPLGRTDDREAIVTTCIRASGTTNDCEDEGNDVSSIAELSFHMEQESESVFVDSRLVLDDSGTCAGVLEAARLTFPVAQRFRLEIRRTSFDVPGALDCITEANAQLATRDCEALEVLHGDFEFEVEGPHESSSSDDDDDWD